MLQKKKLFRTAPFKRAMMTTMALMLLQVFTLPALAQDATVTTFKKSQTSISSAPSGEVQLKAGNPLNPAGLPAGEYTIELDGADIVLKNNAGDFCVLDPTTEIITVELTVSETLSLEVKTDATIKSIWLKRVSGNFPMLVIKGDKTLTTTNGIDSWGSILVEGNLVNTGEIVQAAWNLTVTGTLTSTSPGNQFTIYAVGGGLTIDGGTITATNGTQYAVTLLDGDLTVKNGGTLLSYNNTYYGIWLRGYTQSNHLIVESGGSIITVGNGYNNIYVVGDITVDDGVMLYSGAGNYAQAINIQTTGVVIEVDASAATTQMEGDDTGLTVTLGGSGSAAATWAIAGGKSGVTNTENTVFAEVPGFTVTAAPTTPSVPQNFTATSGNGQVSLTWTAPADDGGSSITGYEVSSDGGLSWVTASSASGHTFTNLINETTYTFNVRAVNAIGSGAVATTSATPKAPIPPTITGPTTMSLTVGYATTSSGTFTVTGNPAPTVSKTSGDGNITWNGTTMMLEIHEGLPTGSYPVTLTASNGITSDAQFTFTLTVNDPVYYSIRIETTKGGSVHADILSAQAGETVTLTLTPDAGYTLHSLFVYPTSSPATTISTSGSSGNGVIFRSFTMPAANVAVTATFENPTYQAAWEAAKAIIEAAEFVMPQDAVDMQSLRYRLANIINELIKSTGFIISPYDIVIFDYNFCPAQAGSPENRSGTNGYFEFRVTPPDTRTSAYNDGTIVATSYNDVANEEWRMQNAELKAWMYNGVLHVSGLTPGNTWSVYNLYGQLIYTGIAAGNEATISAPRKGIIIITDGKKSIKTAVP